jgi:hypothetical protein
MLIESNIVGSSPESPSYVRASTSSCRSHVPVGCKSIFLDMVLQANYLYFVSESFQSAAFEDEKYTIRPLAELNLWVSAPEEILLASSHTASSTSKLLFWTKSKPPPLCSYGNSSVNVITVLIYKSNLILRLQKAPIIQTACQWPD